MTKLTKAAEHRRWVLIYTFLMLGQLGLIVFLSGNNRSLAFAIISPLCLAWFGASLVHYLLSYFECMKREKGSESDEA